MRVKTSAPSLYIARNRPTFARLDPPLSEVCRFISFAELSQKLSEVRDYLRYLRPEFLDELSDSCIVQEA
jgi:hypothetical protein